MGWGRCAAMSSGKVHGGSEITGTSRLPGRSRRHAQQRRHASDPKQPRPSEPRRAPHARTRAQRLCQHVWQGGEGGEVGAAPQLAHAQQRKALAVVVRARVLAGARVGSRAVGGWVRVKAAEAVLASLASRCLAPGACPASTCELARPPGRPPARTCSTPSRRCTVALTSDWPAAALSTA